VPASEASLVVLLNRFISFWTFILFSGLVTYLAGFGRALAGRDAWQERAAVPPETGL
jgi:hypothetical protein